MRQKIVQILLLKKFFIKPRKNNNMVRKILSYLSSRSDFVFICIILLLTTFVYSYLLTSAGILIGDAERYNAYQAYIVKYSLNHFGQLGLWDQFLSSGMSWIS